MCVDRISRIVRGWPVKEKDILKVAVLCFLIIAVCTFFHAYNFQSSIQIAPSTIFNKEENFSQYPGPTSIENINQFSYYIVKPPDANATQNSCRVKHFVGRIKVNSPPISFESLDLKWGWRGFDTLLDDQNTKAQNATRNASSLLSPLPLVWKPYGCNPLQTVAIIIPFRDRHRNLSVFLDYIIPFLRHQQLAYSIFVIHQSPSGRFNRGALLNIGFIEATKLHPYDCFIFHDVDQLPEDDRNMYACEHEPVHFASAMDKFNYRLHYDGFYGGVIAFTPDQFRKIRGFPNKFFGWGGEDDALGHRASYAKLHIRRRSQEISRYTTLKHTRDSGNPVNPQRFKLLKDDLKLRETDTYLNCNYTVTNHSSRYNGLYYEYYVELINSS